MPLPQVLAGPIVRRVVGNEVAVWLALRDPAIVELVVWAGPQRSTGPGAVESGTPSVARGIALTERFGAQLHVAVVVAEASAIIAPGAIHSYDVIVGGQGLRDLGFLRDEAPTTESAGNARPLRLALGYELDRLPSFVTPAPTISDLVLVQGSCRRTNAGGPDAMAYLDDLIAEHRLDLTRRPQQLFLTGDQIYADDLSGCLLPQINAIGRELLGFTETLPIDNRAVPVTIEEFPVQRRRKVVREIGRFSTNDGLHHLLSYGELLAMHLLVWSPSLWRPLATADEVFVPSPNVAANHLSDWEAYYAPKPRDPGPDGLTKWKRKDEPEFTDQLKATEIFRAAVPRVARALANTATYMIFDDHEVTDDWYLSQSWRSRVLTAPFGRAIVRNGYAAYAVCQAWGNDPAAFTHIGEHPKPKNEELLDTLVSVGTDGAFSATAIDKLEQLLGLTKPVIDPEVRFDYTVPGPRHLVRVVDTRTRRTYRGRLGPPKLFGNSLDIQLPPGPLTDGRELLVVVSPVPILMPHAIDALVQPLASGIFDFKSNAKRKAEADHDGPPVSGPERFDVEGWGGDEGSFNLLVRRLATYPRCLILSGDVHFSSGLALDFWSGQDPTVDSRIVQLTSSPGRNSASHKIRAAIFAARFSQQLLHGLPLERLGWSEKSSITVPPGKAISPARRSRMKAIPAVVPAGGWPAGTTIPADKPPEFRFRLGPVRDDRLRSQLEHPEHLPPPLPSFDAGDPLHTYHEVAARHAELALGPTELLRLLVFRSNLGVVRFEAEGQSHTVVHELYSMDAPDSTEGGAYTIHRASLALSPALAGPSLQVVADA
jgi:hypothetical protein